jgi:predicted GH43/DUF377 family glycosyl hydrolase
MTHQAPYINIAPAGWIVDPVDRNKFLFYVGRFRGNHSMDADVAVYTGTLQDPCTFTFDSVVLAHGAAGSDDERGVRFGSIVEVEGIVHYYYVGIRGDGAQVIMVAVSRDGRHFTKRGTVLAPDRVHESYLTDPTVIVTNGTWYMYVTGKSAVKRPTQGIVIYTSADGFAWKRTGVTAIPPGNSPECDSKYIEGCAVHRNGPELLALYTCCSSSDVWSIGMARSTDPLAIFSKDDRNPVFQCSPAGWDSGGVAVPLLVGTPSGKTILYYQGSMDKQPADTWDIGAATL